MAGAYELLPSIPVCAHGVPTGHYIKIQDICTFFLFSAVRSTTLHERGQQVKEADENQTHSLTCITVCKTMMHDSAGLGLSSKSIWFSTTFVSRTWQDGGPHTDRYSPTRYDRIVKIYEVLLLYEVELFQMVRLSDTT